MLQQLAIECSLVSLSFHAVIAHVRRALRHTLVHSQRFDGGIECRLRSEHTAVLLLPASVQLAVRQLQDASGHVHAVHLDGTASGQLRVLIEKGRQHCERLWSGWPLARWLQGWRSECTRMVLLCMTAAGAVRSSRYGEAECMQRATRVVRCHQ